MTMLSTRSLGVRLGDREILRNLNMDLGPGSFVGLIGPNGVGKSSLLRACAGVLRHSGEVLFDGRRRADWSHAERVGLLGYLAQSREIAWPMSVTDVVALGRLPRRGPFAGPSASDAEIVARTLRRTNLEALAERPVDRLSGGETARVLLARALAEETAILLADEPIAGLDPAHQLTTMQTFADLVREGRTVLASLHDLSLAARFCDRLIVLAGGRIVADGTAEDTLTADLLARVFGMEADVVRRSDGLCIVPLRAIACNSEENRR